MNTILSRAQSLGFSGSDLHEAAEFIDNEVKIADARYECEVSGHGHDQHVSFGNYTCSGQIIDFAAHWYDEPGTEVTHSHFVDDDGMVIELYYVVEKNSYNTPVE